MSQAAPARPVVRVRNFYNRVGLPPVSEWMRQFTTRAQQAMDAGDPTLANMVKKQCETMLGFTTFRFPRYRPSDVHRAVCAQLERVEAREIDRLMLLMPPRHGKSELASKSYPAWSIGRKPWKQFISGSASMPLAQDWGREVRNIVNSEAFQLVYETRLSPDSQAAGKWNTQQGGSYYSVGVEGGVREIDRLMLLMPPRHGKSELASKSYPAWSIGRKPWKQFISGSASMPLAQDWGREVRNIVNSEAFQLVYETRLSPDSQAAGKWNTQQGGSYYSVGVEGGVMGRGAHDTTAGTPPIGRSFSRRATNPG